MAVVKRGDKWRVMVRDSNGEWFPAESFETKAAASRRERELLDARDKGAKRGIACARDMFFEEYWTKWSSEMRLNISKGWIISQDQMMRDHIMPHLRVKTLADIERDDIRKVIQKAAEKGLGAQTQIHIYRLLSRMFKAAVEEYEILDSSPVRTSMKAQAPEVVRPFFKAEESRAFLEKVKDEYVGPAIWLMISCGLRIGEVQALQWKNVDFENGAIFIARQWQRKEKAWKLPKNKKPIRVPMPDGLAEYLASKRPTAYDPEALVCRNRHGGIIHYDTIYGGLKRLCAKHNFIRLTPHELRHSCSDLWIDAGATDTDIKTLFNHKSIKSTERYLHKTDERVTRVARTVRVRKDEGKATGHLRIVE